MKDQRTDRCVVCGAERTTHYDLLGRRILVVLAVSVLITAAATVIYFRFF